VRIERIQQRRVGDAAAHENSDIAIGQPVGMQPLDRPGHPLAFLGFGVGSQVPAHRVRERLSWCR
jgi:hypothetical protein